MSSNDSCFTFAWTIENFSFITLNDRRFIESPEIFLYDVHEYKMSLKLYPRGIPDHLVIPSVGEDELLLIINNSNIMTDLGILSEIVVQRKEEVIRLRKLNPNTFLLELEKLHEILKLDDDIIIFTCKLQQTNWVCKAREFIRNREAVTKAEIHRECFKTKINFHNADEKKISVAFSHFDIFLTVLDGFLKVRIERKENDKEALKNRYLYGKFLLVATKGSDIVAFHVQKYFDRDETEWISPNYEIKSNGEEKFYFNCDIKTNATQTGWLNLCPSDASIKVENHLQYVPATNLYPDIVLRVKGVDIAAQQVILAARSPVFARLIKNNKSSIVEINDYDLKTVTKFLDFLYRDQFVECDSKEVIKLCAMAENYEVETLAAKCFSLYDELKSKKY